MSTQNDMRESIERKQGRTLRVLAVTNMFPAPDAPHSGRFIEQQIEGIRRAGVEVEVLFLDRFRRGMRIYANLPALLRKKIAECQPDLVHVMYGGIMAGFVAHLVSDRPVVVSFHGTDLLGQSFERPIRRFLSACGVFASKQAAKRCSGVILVAEHLRQSLPAASVNGHVQVIPCGIDVNLFKPHSRDHCCDELGWRKEAFHILFQNTGDPVKRPALAYAALDRLRELGEDAEIHELCGVKYDQVPVWLNASDALLVTSFHEGSPTIVKEALACNLAIVSVEVGDISRRINGIRGCHISSPAPRDLADKLRCVRLDSRRIDGEKAIRALSLDYCARQLTQFYEQVMRTRANIQAPAFI